MKTRHPRRFQLRNRVSVLIGHVERLRVEGEEELSGRSRGTLTEIEAEAYVIGGLLEQEAPPDSARSAEASNATLVIADQPFWADHGTEDLGTDRHVSVIGDMDRAQEELLDGAVDRVVLDGTGEIAFGLPTADELTAAGGEVDVAFVSVYESPQFGPRLGYAGILDAGAISDSLGLAKGYFNLGSDCKIAVWGDDSLLSGAVEITEAADVEAVDPAVIVVPQSAVASVTPDLLDTFRGPPAEGARPVLVALTHDAFATVGFVPTVGADRYLVRPPTALGLLGELLEPTEADPPWRVAWD